MRLKQSGTALIIVLVVGALVANSTSAATAQTTAAQWYTGTGTGTTLTTDRATTVSTVGGFLLTVVLGGKLLELKATGIECVSCSITNAEVTSKAGKVAMGKGSFKFTGVTAVSPTGCTVREKAGGTVGVLALKPLVIHADWMNETGTVAYQQFIPEAGATATFASVYLEGGQCESIEGSYNVTGSLFSEAANATGVQATAQNNSFSSAIQTATGGALKLGSNATMLTGSAVTSIGGTAFGIH